VLIMASPVRRCSCAGRPRCADRAVLLSFKRLRARTRWQPRTRLQRLWQELGACECCSAAGRLEDGVPRRRASLAQKLGVPHLTRSDGCV
jgi:hypothetical protein